jgi:isoleucyl-tRNA synthetase
MYQRATRPIMDFIVEDLSRWYVRLIRSRTWKESDDADKLAAYYTLHYALRTLATISAPVMPYLSEEIYQNFNGESESVHLAPYPQVNDALVDVELEAQMAIARKLVDACANARQKAEIKQRWPVASIIIESEDPVAMRAVEDLQDVLKEQINAKEIKIGAVERAYEAKPNYKNLGPRFKGDAKKVADAILAAPKAELMESLKETGSAVAGEYEITMEDVVLEEHMPEGWMHSELDLGRVFVNTVLTDDLRSEAMARELIRRIQEMRKELDLKVDDRIATAVDCDFREIVEKNGDYIANETRSSSFTFAAQGGGHFKEWAIDEYTARIWVEKAE